jgi:hypothetical protein
MNHGRKDTLFETRRSDYFKAPSASSPCTGFDSLGTIRAARCRIEDRFSVLVEAKGDKGSTLVELAFIEAGG